MYCLKGNNIEVMINIWFSMFVYMYGIYFFNWFGYDLVVSMGDVVNNSFL